MSIKQAKFNIGQLVRHSESGYRGVIVDIDSEYSRRDMDIKPGQEPKIDSTEPWYHVLLEEQNLQAYIAEQQLQRDNIGEPIDHVFLDEYFSDFEQDHYIIRRALN
ncbi:MAG: heat shock protein HspQ [Gammaproteobacteria bacterium]|nr:heat shock protein HspQ [Gammaproteobacteria bacterium]